MISCLEKAMTAIESMEIKPAAAKARKSPAKFEKFFYPAVGLLFLALTLIGFHHFYLQGRAYPGRPLTAEIKSLIILHGVSMALWILLFAAQPFLILAKRHKIHMTLGKIGAVLALFILVSGLHFAVNSTHAAPPGFVIWGLSARAFMIVPFSAVLLFAAFVGIAVWKRKRPAVHRAMMFLGTLSAVGAAISRIDAFNSLFLGTICERLWGPFFMTLVIGPALLLIHWALTRKFDKPMAIGLAAMFAVCTFAMQFARTGAWDSFVSLFV
jgi:hypothetical protein